MVKYLFALLFSTALFGEQFTYSIVEHPYRFSTYFEMQGKHGFVGRSIKSKAAIRTCYDLYDADGVYQAQGIIQILSLGSLYPWGKDIDIYDPSGKHIGFIDGSVLTSASAKYCFYDENNEWVATAYLDYSCSGFVVTSAKNERTIANLRRNFVDNALDHWDITFYEPGSLDLRLLKIFSTFAIDHQEFFKEDK